MRTQIMEVLDLDLIRQQADNDALDIQGLASYIITTMGKLCAPDRDDDIKKLSENTNNIVTLFRWVHVYSKPCFETFWCLIESWWFFHVYTLGKYLEYWTWWKWTWLTWLLTTWGSCCIGRVWSTRGQPFRESWTKPPVSSWQKMVLFVVRQCVSLTRKMSSDVLRCSGQHNFVDQDNAGGAAVDDCHHGTDQKSGQSSARAIPGPQHCFTWHPHMGLWKGLTTWGERGMKCNYDKEKDRFDCMDIHIQ